MKYVVESDPTYETLTERIILMWDLQARWDDIQKTYGVTVTKWLKDVVPNDPYLLYDYSVLSLIGEGKTKAQAIDIVDGFKKKDWKREFNYFSHSFIMNIGKRYNAVWRIPEPKSKSDNYNYRNLKKEGKNNGKVGNENG